jgi:hypothetical protein
VIIVVPIARPVTMPLEEPIDARDVVLLQIPPPVALPNVEVCPKHTFSEPVIALKGLTVTFAVVKQPVPIVYDMVTIPGVTPDTIPEAEPTLPMTSFPLLHVPPVVALNKVVVSPWQTLAMPVMFAGSGFTVTILVAIQPVPSW